MLYVTIRATAITTRKGVRSLLKKLFFGETKKSLFQYAFRLLVIVIASARPIFQYAFQYAFRLLLIVIASARPVSAC